MTIGVPKEIKDKEARVALTPAGAHALAARGHRVLIEQRAGTGSGYPDADYESAGATIAPDAAAVFGEADLIVKVKEPQLGECAQFKPNQILFTYLHLASYPEGAQALQKSGVTALAYETVQAGRRLPLLEPMSEIAGRMATLVAAQLLAHPAGGNGRLLCGVPGAPAGRVLVVGGGAGGFNAARIAADMGASVTIFELDPERMRLIDLASGGRIRTEHSTETALAAALPQADVVIGAVLLPGARAPRVLRRDLLARMQPGSVFVDLAIDQGGCSDTSRPTSHSQPTYVEAGVVHYCVTNMPGAFPRTATLALTGATLRYIEAIADLGVDGSAKRLPELAGGLNIRDGAIVHPSVAAALKR